MQLTAEQRAFVLAHEREDVRATALRFSREDMPLLLSQIAGRQVAEKKMPSWYAHPRLLYPPHLSLEQSSSELTARYKASLVLDAHLDGKRERFADLTGGMGVDFSHFALLFGQSVYVEQNQELCRIAEHNFVELGLENVKVCCADAVDFLRAQTPFDWLYLDPARRDSAGQKVFRIEDCTPDVSALKPLLLEKAHAILLKYSPMLDISLAIETLGNVREVHVVSVDNECKELLFLLQGRADEFGAPLFVAVNLKKTGEEERFLFTSTEEQQAVISFVDNPQRYLYEPNASLLKAGAFKSVAQAYGMGKLHTNSHLYTSDRLVGDFPGRIFEVDDFFLPNKRNLKAFLAKTKKANITVRNFPVTVAEIRRKTRLADGGDTYLFATTLADERKVWILCRKVI